MAGASLLTLIDDIATLLDDVSVMSKVAAQKTAGVLGDDLALNAQQVTGVKADRELPVVWAVAKGSLKNKAILVPAALLISFFLPILVTPLLMLGGLYLCFEGVEKLAHKFLHNAAEDEEHHQSQLAAVADPGQDMVAFEQAKIKGAIRTDFILSAEIITITLGTVTAASLLEQVSVLVVIAVGITVLVYGLVAAIVKLDDLGLYLTERQGDSSMTKVSRTLGSAILSAAPWLMKTLSVVGTIAMFMVGGGILTHGIPVVHEFIHGVAHHGGSIPAVEFIVSTLVPTLLNTLFGIVAGAVVLLGLTLIKRVKS